MQCGRACEGEYSCLAAVFRLRRNVGYFVLQAYVPSILIVVISWVGFWISRHSDPARVSLGVTTVLTMTTITTSSAHNFLVSYLMAMDVWCATCMLFVFAALLEFAFVSVLLRRERKRTQRDAPTSVELVSSPRRSIFLQQNSHFAVDRRFRLRSDLFTLGLLVNTSDRRSQNVKVADTRLPSVGFRS